MVLGTIITIIQKEALGVIVADIGLQEEVISIQVDLVEVTIQVDTV